MNISNVELFNDDFLFVFEDEVTKDGFFRQDSDKIIVITRDTEETARKARYVKVVKTGPKCVDLNEGEVVVVEALKWTKRITIGDDEVWKSDERQVIAKLDV